MSTPVTPAVPVPAKPTLLDRISQSVWIAAGVALVVIAYVWGETQGTAPLKYTPSALQNIANVLTPLVAISLFIERAVEVVISAWRNQGATDLQNAASSADPAVAAGASQALNLYRARTQKLSFLVSLTLSAVAAMVGVRAVAPLVQNAPNSGVFEMLDVVVTALLLAGGADGIHQIITTFTDFLDSTKSKMNPTPAAPATPAGGGAQGNAGGNAAP
jgi:hypothetical protein